MNILERYEDYRNKHTEEFKSLLLNVKDAILDSTETEDFPEDHIQNIFEKEIFRSLVCFEINPNDLDEEIVYAYYWDDVSTGNFGEFHYNSKAVKELRDFLKRYYPGILDKGTYYIDLEDRTISFHFIFKNDLKETEFSEYGYRIEEYDDAQEESIVSEYKIMLFNDDIAKVIGKKTEGRLGDWNLTIFKFERNGKLIKTDEFIKGTLEVDLSF